MTTTFDIMNNIANTVLRKGGRIYGGYVRDVIRRDLCTERFNKEFPTEDITNIAISPETLDRLLVPSDIDIEFDSVSDFRKFKRALHSMSIKIDGSTKNPSYPGYTKRYCVYVGVSLEDILKGIRSTCTGINDIIKKKLTNNFSNVTRMSDNIYLDITIKNPDVQKKLCFECNGLVMTNNSIMLTDSLVYSHDPLENFKKLMKVYQDIGDKKAICTNLIKNRWNKMASKGWNLYESQIHKIPMRNEECIICFDTIYSTDAYKFSCCNAYYHRECMNNCIKDLRTKNKIQCIHCRSTIHTYSRNIEEFLTF